jgi:hypothetical protein
MEYFCKICKDEIRNGDKVVFVGEGDIFHGEIRGVEIIKAIHRVCWKQNGWGFLKKDRKGQ